MTHVIELPTEDSASACAEQVPMLLRIAKQIPDNRYSKMQLAAYGCAAALDSLYGLIGRDAVQALIAGTSVAMPLDPTRNQKSNGIVQGNVTEETAVTVYKAMIANRPGRGS